MSDQVGQSVRDQEFACDARISRQKVRQRGRKMIDREGRERVNPQVSARRQAGRGGVGLGGLKGGEEGRGRSEVKFSLPGQVPGSREAVWWRRTQTKL